MQTEKDAPSVETPSSDQLAAAPALSPIERRVLGVLLEKGFTTPDNYPLTSNAVLAACNQKSARDPVTHYEAHEIDEALLGLKSKHLVLQVFAATGRVERWKHNLREAWSFDRPQLAVMAELFLRGPQSEGDLRGRASRMTPLASLDDLRSALEPLSERGFVRRLSPQGRKRGVMWGHLCLNEREKAELDQIAEREASRGDDEGPTGQPRTDRISGTQPSLERIESQLQDLATRLAAVEEAVEDLRGRHV